MAFIWDDLIDRARTYLDDDHDDTEGFIAPERWLSFANVEYAQLYRKWIRMGLVAPAPTDTTFSNTHTVALTGVLAIVGVAEDLGNGNVRVLTPAQSQHGQSPFWSYTSGEPGSYWKATGSADALTVTLEPRPTSGNYFVRYIPTVAYVTSSTASIDLPYGADERLVLGMALRAKLKAGERSALLEGLLQQADQELNFAAFSKLNDSPRVKVRRPPYNRLSGFPDPSLYRYF